MKYFWYSRNANLVLKKILKQVPCIECEAHFKNKSQLENHINSVHLKIKPFRCDSCDSSFAYKRNLTSHIRTVHEKIKRFRMKKVSCTKCESCFTSKRGLEEVWPAGLSGEVSLGGQTVDGLDWFCLGYQEV